MAQGRLAKRAHQLLDEALALLTQDPDAAGALGYWGLTALALDGVVGINGTGSLGRVVPFPR